LFGLTIGIDRYAVRVYPYDLMGDVSDADSVVQFLIEKGAAPERIRSLRNEQATRMAIRHELTDLITNPSIKENDPIVIYFAGQGNLTGAPVEWEDWSQSISLGGRYGRSRLPEDPLVQCLVPYDFNQGDAKGAIVHGILDRTLGMIMHRLAKAKGNNITVILDCCYSGSGTASINSLPRCTSQSSRPIPANLDQDLLSVPLTPGSSHRLPEFQHHGTKSHIVLTACKPDEEALEILAERGANGQFTTALLLALRSLDMGSTTYSELIRRMKPLCNQNPQCHGEVDRLLFSNNPRGTRRSHAAKLALVKSIITTEGAKVEDSERPTSTSRTVGPQDPASLLEIEAMKARWRDFVSSRSSRAVTGHVPLSRRR
ncbi:hypothetical protein BKA70DRAFT_1098511, partial [Coprinopsis sp. MPI-PUGE-AT-0042]